MKLNCSIDTDMGTMEMTKDGQPLDGHDCAINGYFMDNFDTGIPEQYCTFSHAKKNSDGTTNCTYGTFKIGDKASYKTYSSLTKKFLIAMSNVCEMFKAQAGLLDIFKKAK